MVMNSSRYSSGPSAGGRFRVVHVVPELSVDGLTQVVAALCRSTDHERFDVSVLALNSVERVGEELREEGYRVELIGRRGRPHDYATPIRIAAALRGRGVDLVHTHNTQAFVEGSVGAMLAGVRRVIQTDHARLFPDKWRYMAAERLVSRYAERVIGVSDHTCGELRKYIRIPEHKLLTVPNGIVPPPTVSAAEIARKRAELGIDGSGPILGIGARLVAQKAHHDLLTAVGILRDRYPDLTVLICGDGELRGELERRVEEERLGRNVRLLGIRHDMRAILPLFDIYVLPSIWEGLPMALLEAMAEAIPIVASAVGGVPTAVRDGYNGLTIPPSRPDLFADGVASLLDDAKLRNRLGANGRTLFLERFTAEQMTRTYEQLYLNPPALTGIGRPVLSGSWPRAAKRAETATVGA